MFRVRRIFPLLLILLISLSVFGGINLPEKYPDSTEILNNPGEHNGSVVSLRGRYQTTETNSSNLLMSRYSKEFVITTNRTLKVEKDDIIDVRGTLIHINSKTIIETNELLHRESWQHKWLFYRSILGALALVVIVIIDYRRVVEVLGFG